MESTLTIHDALDQDKLAKIYTDALKTPVISSAKLLSEDEHVLNIYSEWTIDDITRKDRTTIAKNFTVLKKSLDGNGNPIVYTSSPVTLNKKLSSFSKSGLKKAVVVGGKDGNGNAADSDGAQEFLQIFDQNTLVKTYDLKEIDLHKGIYTLGFGCTMAWSKDETKLMYLAEKKLPKSKPFFTSPGIKNGDEKRESETAKGEEFAFRQSWGETLNNCYDSVIVVLDVTTDKFNIIELPDKAFPSDLQWKDNATVIGVSFTNVQWRLGLVFCSNRESRIFQIGVDGSNFKYLNEPGISSVSPRVSPDGNYIVWQERIVLGPHDMSRKIVGLKFCDSTATTIYEHNPKNQVPIYNGFPRSCWSPDGSKLFTVTANDINFVLLAFEMKNGVLSGEPQIKRGVSGVLSIGSNFILGYRSQTAQPPTLILLDHELTKMHELSPSKSVLPFPLKSYVVQGIASPNSFYYGPTSENVKPNSVPLIVWIHGGPHAVMLDEFSCEGAVFLKLGFGVLQVNYIGSTGGKKDVTEDLLGHIGDDDVKDCQAILKSLLAVENTVNPRKVFIFGGSHSGFLGAHLIAQYPDSYRAAVLRNPVTDVLALTSVSDITDWGFVEAGVNLDEYVTPIIHKLEDAKKFMGCSPIHNVAKVKAPTLLLLGSEDLRVPMSQGIAYYRALKAAGKTTEVRVYPDTHSLRKVPVRFDSVMHSLIWYFTYLKSAAK